MTPITSKLKDGMWKGRRCFIVGGGSSLKEFDWSLLDGELWIGLNAAWLKKIPTIAYTFDLRCLDLFYKDYKKRWDEVPIKVHRHIDQLMVDPEKYKDIIGLKLCKGWGKSLDKGLYRANNAGVGALNLAEVLGANPIYLLGFDMKHREGISHYHKTYPKHWYQDENVYKSFIKNFKQTRCFLKSDVFNLGPDSALDCYEKKDLKDIFNLK